MLQWGARFLNIAQRQMIENSGFHAHVRHRLAYGSQFWDPAPNWRTLMKLDPDPIQLINAAFAASIRVSSAFILVRNVPISTNC